MLTVREAAKLASNIARPYDYIKSAFEYRGKYMFVMQVGSDATRKRASAELGDMGAYGYTYIVSVDKETKECDFFSIWSIGTYDAAELAIARKNGIDPKLYLNG